MNSRDEIASQISLSRRGQRKETSFAHQGAKKKSQKDDRINKMLKKRCSKINIDHINSIIKDFSKEKRFELGLDSQLIKTGENIDKRSDQNSNKDNNDNNALQDTNTSMQLQNNMNKTNDFQSNNQLNDHKQDNLKRSPYLKFSGATNNNEGISTENQKDIYNTAYLADFLTGNEAENNDVINLLKAIN